MALRSFGGKPGRVEHERVLSTVRGAQLTARFPADGAVAGPAFSPDGRTRAENRVERVAHEFKQGAALFLAGICQFIEGAFAPLDLFFG